MNLFVLGINHRSAPVEIREKVNFEPERLPAALRDLLGAGALDECLIVSTCNRTELYCSGGEAAQERARNWLMEAGSLDEKAGECVFLLRESAAVEHAFQVAAGLDSLIVGEPQILGQMKEAWRIAHQEHTLGPVLNRLFQQAFAVAKQVRTDTAIGHSAVSVAYAAVSLARQIFARFDRHCALLIGAGETIELCARHLHGQGLGRMVIANRSIDRARDLAVQYDAYAIGLHEIPAHIAEADIIVSSTASPVPLLAAQTVADAMKQRRRQPMFLVDLAVPRDIEAEVADIDDVYLYGVDDLQNVIEENRRLREEAAGAAGEMIDAEVARFDRQLRMLGAVPAIRTVRERGLQLSADARDEAMRMLTAGRDPAEVVEYLAATLTNRLLHAPSARMRRAGEDGDDDLLRAAMELFGIDDLD